jgi:hypothetical protein
MKYLLLHLQANAKLQRLAPRGQKFNDPEGKKIDCCCSEIFEKFFIEQLIEGQINSNQNNKF